MNKPCDMHENPEFDYRTAHADARERTRRGEQQRTCPKCKKFIWESLYHSKWWVGPEGRLPKAVEEFLKKHFKPEREGRYYRVDEVAYALAKYPDSPFKHVIDTADVILPHLKELMVAVQMDDDYGEKEVTAFEQALAALKGER